MVPETLDAVAQLTVPYLPNGGSGIMLRASLHTDVVRGLTAREGRRRMSTVLTYEVEQTLTLSATDAAAIRNAIGTTAGDLPVRLPVWPFVGQTAVTPRWWATITPGTRLGAATAAWSTSVPSLTGAQEAVPSLLGTFIDSPRFASIRPDVVDVHIRWRESSPWLQRLTLPTFTWDDGPEVLGSAIPMFPVTADWAEVEDVTSVEVTRNRIGFGRELSSSAYPQLGQRNPVYGFTTGTPDALRILRFFEEHGATTDTFWVACSLEDAHLAEDNDGSDEVTLEDADLIGDFRHLIFTTAAGVVHTRKVLSIAGDVLTLDSALPVLDADSTLVGTIALCRFSTPSISMRFDSPNLVLTDIRFQEVREEYLAVDETAGETIGGLETKAFLFTVRLGEETFRYTSFERDIPFGYAVADSLMPVLGGEVSFVRMPQATGLGPVVGAKETFVVKPQASELIPVIAAGQSLVTRAQGSTLIPVVASGETQNSTPQANTLLIVILSMET